MAATASNRDRISELSDDLLTRILSFAPAKEAASTAVLSRRWRSLWLQSGALNLDTSSYDRAHDPALHFLEWQDRAIPKKRRAFSADARQALDAMFLGASASPAPHLRRITVTAAERTYGRCGEFVADVLPFVLRHPAASWLEELRVACVPNKRPHSFRADDEHKRGEMYVLRPGSLPCAQTLRLLDLTDCKLQPLTPPPQMPPQPPPIAVLPPLPQMPHPMTPPPPPPLPQLPHPPPSPPPPLPQLPPPSPPPMPLSPPPPLPQMPPPPPPPLPSSPPPPLPQMPPPMPPQPLMIIRQPQSLLTPVPLHRSSNIPLPPHYMVRPTMPPPPPLLRPLIPTPRAAFPILPDSTHQPAQLPSTSFPSLTSLRLHCCKLALNDLQHMIHASPRLASLTLDRVFFDGCRGYGTKNSLRLRCQTATNLSLIFDTAYNFTIMELDVPQLRSLHYVGNLAEDSSFALKSHTPHLARVDLDITITGNGNGYGPAKDVKYGAPFWHFLGSICHCKSLKLNCSPAVENFLIHPNEEAKLLCTFTNLTQLVVKAKYRDGEHEDVATILSYLLRRCPVISELKINLVHNPFHFKRNPEAGLSAYVKAQLAMKRSINKLKMHSSLMFSVDDHDDDVDVQAFPDLPGWTESSFTCVRNSLRKLFVEFSMEERGCFEIQLIRFFVENTLLLKEVYIGDGDQELREHINYKVAKWRANSVRRNQLMKQEFKVYDHWEKEVPSYVHNARKYSSTFGSDQLKRQKISN